MRAGHSGEAASAGAGADLRLWLLGAFTALAMVKLYLAANLDLFGDEAFYWQCAQRLAPAYADHPPLTALLIRLGTELLGQGVIGVRLLFVSMSLAIPALVWLLAKPLVGERDAWLAAGLTLLLPLAAWLGIAALPDVPLLFFSLLAMVGFERATRTDSTRVWLLFGVAVAGGFATHYRFVVLPASCGLYLLLTRTGRAQWRKPGLWLATAVGLLGLLPVIWFNLQENFAPLKYQFGERHPWQFDPRGLLHAVEQAGVSTPALYGFLLVALVVAIARARRGDDRAALLACYGGVPIVLFALLAPVADQTRFSVHWPLPGYLPLLVLVPGVVREFLQKSPARSVRRAIGWLIPALGVAGTLGLGGYYVVVANLDRWYGMFPVGEAASNMAGWSELGDYATGVLDRLGPNGPLNLLADRYYTSAQLEFELSGRLRIGALDESKIHSHGRVRQYRAWGMDERSFRRRHLGERALVVVDESKARYGFWRYAKVRAICRFFDRVELIDSVDIFGSAQRFRFYLGQGLRAPGEGTIPDNGEGPLGEEFKPFLPLSPGCPVPSFGDLPTVTDGDRFRGQVSLGGWALNNTAGVSRIELLIDREPVAIANYGSPLPGFDESPFWRGGVSDPNHPNLGFDLSWNTTATAPGRHEMAIRVTAANGRTDRLAKRDILIE